MRALFGLLFVISLIVTASSLTATSVFGQLTVTPATPPAAVDDGSIKGYFLANNGGVDFSINPDDPGEDGGEDRQEYGLLASIISASKPTPTDQIREAEINGDIDIRVI
jgi:hypothetical protein